jgi:thymidylate synthase ThyX
MNRHRAGWAISEGSLRFIRFGENIPYWEPDSIKGPDIVGDAVVQQTIDSLLDDATLTFYVPQDASKRLDHKRQLSRELFRRAFGNQEAVYRALTAVWASELAPESKFAQKKQITSMMRRIIGLGVATGGVWSGNIRALRHVITMRASEHAEEEMLHVFTRVANKLAEREPNLFGDFYLDDNGFYRPRYVKV